MMEKTYEDYFKELDSYLNRLTDDERGDVMSYYQDYATDGNLHTYREISAQIGLPKRLAKQILADYSIQIDDGPRPTNETLVKSSKRHARLIWFIILGLLASPVALPVAAVLIIILMTVIIIVVAVAIAILGTLVAGFVTAVSFVVAGLGVLTQSVSTALFFIGIGIAGIGIALVVTPIFWLLVKAIFKGSVTFTKWIGRKFIKRTNTNVESESEVTA
ncbi:DUF1700 domain-containing protein [Periweissella cryptocerci]|uniref:DUF1700 domain-containing protein n=1 Tax=Periweissella cryptocerci TaxID=2506420 RepID=A0A4P6YWL5_9LACO|nr:DUF1700 domain-containing protein [Periweissella cryptocerci]QBO37299.1 DUF1700 domain-containing protein [Periweissella cryptocerci]